MGRGGRGALSVRAVHLSECEVNPSMGLSKAIYAAAVSVLRPNEPGK